MKDTTKEAGPVQDAGAKSAGGVQLSCKVIQGGLVVAGWKKGRGRVIALPADQAAALEQLGKIKIQGPA